MAAGTRTGRGTRFHDVASVVAHATLWDGDPAAFAYPDDYARQQAALGEFEVCLAAAYITILTAHLTAHDRPDDADTLFDQAAETIAAHCVPWLRGGRGCAPIRLLRLRCNVTARDAGTLT